MLISIIIPAYNEEKYLPQTLTALLGQKKFDFEVEIIVANSSSADQTSVIAKKMGVYAITVPKVSPGFARQKGVEKARGEIIACIDADTIAAPDWLVRIAHHFRHENIVGLTGNVFSGDKNLLFILFYKFFTPIFYRLNYLLGKTIFQGQNFAVRKEAFWKIGGFKEGVVSAEDADLGNRLSIIGKVIYAQDVVVYTSARRLDEGIMTLLRWPMAYLKLVWGINTGNFEKRQFPSIR